MVWQAWFDQEALAWEAGAEAWPEKSGGGIEPSPHDLEFD
jgi:hypothetical protein